MKIKQTFVAVGLGIMLAAQSASAAAGADTVFIKVKSVKLRGTPQYFGTGIATLNYGDAVQKIESGEDWWKVKKGGSIGYVPTSALSSRRIVLGGAKAPDANIKSSDVVLAGKGFSKEAEKQLSQTDKKLNFAAVNRMESLKISDQELLGFVNSGRLSKEG